MPRSTLGSMHPAAAARAYAGVPYVTQWHVLDQGGRLHLTMELGGRTFAGVVTGLQGTALLPRGPFGLLMDPQDLGERLF